MRQCDDLSWLTLLDRSPPPLFMCHNLIHSTAISDDKCDAVQDGELCCCGASMARVFCSFTVFLENKQKTEQASDSAAGKHQNI